MLIKLGIKCDHCEKYFETDFNSNDLIASRSINGECIHGATIELSIYYEVTCPHCKKFNTIDIEYNDT